MKKTLLIAIGAGAVIILFAVWLYLLIYGTPTKVTEYFTDFSLFGGGATNLIPPPVTTSTSTTDTTLPHQPLRQLTLRPVIGFADVHGTTSTSTLVRYAEAGTGHIYQINLESGEETRLSNVTVPNAEFAAFSPNGKYVAIRSGFGLNYDMILVTLASTDAATAETLTEHMNEFSWDADNQLRYTEITSNGMSGVSLNPTTKQTHPLFNVPFQTGTMIWSQNKNTPDYIYPRPAGRLTGYLYAVKNGGITRMPLSGNGFIADANSRYIISSELQEITPVSSIYTVATGATSPAPFIVEPKKCAFSPAVPTQVFCGSELGATYSEHFPDDWYKGTRNFSDQIWMINLTNHSAIKLVTPLTTVGRELDITDMRVSTDSTMLYFLNKNDNTLWLYEI